MLWNEKEKSRIRAVQRDNLRRLLGISGMDIVSNARIRELCVVKKSLDGRIDEAVLKWSGHVERIESNMIASVLVIVQCVRHGRDGLIP